MYNFIEEKVEKLWCALFCGPSHTVGMLQSRGAAYRRNNQTLNWYLHSAHARIIIMMSKVMFWTSTKTKQIWWWRRSDSWSSCSMYGTLPEDQLQAYFTVLNKFLTRQMRGERKQGYIEHIWLRKLVQYISVLGLDDDSTMDGSQRSAISVFSFLDAVRTHEDIEEVERCRKGSTGTMDCYSYADALKYAIMYGHSKYSEYLLERHVDEALRPAICCPLLMLAVRLDRPQLVEQLCRYSRAKAEPDLYIDKPGCSAMECGRTALHIAAETGNLPITKILLQYGANTQATDDFGNTPLGRIFVIFRLRSPHINFNTLLCVHELLKCETKLGIEEVSVLQRIMDNNDTWWDKLGEQWCRPQPGPFTLKHLCRCAIRSALSYPKLPEGVEQLGLPTMLWPFLSLQEADPVTAEGI